MWNSIIAGGATGFTLAVRQGMAPALVSGGIGKVIEPTQISLFTRSDLKESCRS